MSLDDLVLAIQAGDARAWTELGQRLTASLDAYFRRWFGEADANDLTQTALIIIADKLPQFEVRAGQPFHRWVRAIARTQVQEAYRQQQRRARLANELAALERAPSTKISARLARVERVEIVEQELDKLDSHYRRVIEHDLRDGDARVLADREQIKDGSVRTRRRRAYRLLRERVRRRSKPEDWTPTPP